MERGKGRLRVSYTDNEPLESEIPDLLKCTKQWLAREKYEATRQEHSCEKYTAHKSVMRTESHGDCYHGNRLKHANNGKYMTFSKALENFENQSESRSRALTVRQISARIQASSHRYGKTYSQTSFTFSSEFHSVVSRRRVPISLLFYFKRERITLMHHTSRHRTFDMAGNERYSL